MANKAATAPVAAKASRTPTLALAGLSTSVLLASLGTSISNVALPTLAQTFGATFQQVQWIVLAYLLAITTLVVSVGRLGDMIGKRRLLISGLVIFTAASVACGLALNLSTLIAARVIQAVGAAIMMAMGIALVAEALPKGRTGSAMGLLGTMSAIGTALGPTLGGALVSHFDWPFIYFINVPLGVAGIYLLYYSLPEDVRPPGPARISFDFIGTLLLAATLAAYSLAMTGSGSSFDFVSLGLLAAAAGFLGIFVWTETRVSFPLINPAIFRTPGLSLGFLMSAFVTTVVMATLVVGPFYLSQALGLDIAQVGLVMSCGPLVAALSGIPAGKVVDRYGADKVLMAGLLTTAAGCAGMASAPLHFGITGYVLPLAIITAGYAVFQAANNTAIMSGISHDRRGVVSGMLNLSRNLGLITGASAMGTVFVLGKSLTVATSTVAVVASNGMKLTFWVATILTLASVGLALRAHMNLPNYGPGGAHPQTPAPSAPPTADT